MQFDSMTRSAYIQKHSHLFWYTPEDKLLNISDKFLLETILNLGSLEDVKELFQVIGINKAADIFFSLKGRMKLNYYPEIYHFLPWYLIGMHTGILNQDQLHLLPLISTFNMETIETLVAFANASGGIV